MTNFSRPETVRKAVVNASVDHSSSRRFATSVVLGTTDTRNANPAIVISTVPEIMYVKSVEANAPANITMPETIAINALKAITTSPNAYVIITFKVMSYLIIFKMTFFSLRTACECEAPGSISEACDLESGQCQCDHNFGGRACERCEHGFFNYPTCTCKIKVYLKKIMRIYIIS